MNPIDQAPQKRNSKSRPKLPYNHILLTNVHLGPFKKELRSIYAWVKICLASEVQKGKRHTSTFICAEFHAELLGKPS